MGYFETTMIYRDIRVTRQVYAPDGDDPVLLIDVEIENQRLMPVDLCHYEYWDVNRYQLKLQWFRTGPLTARFGDSERHDLNDQFMSSIRYDEQQHALRFHQEPCSPDAPPPDEVSPIDWWPADIFLADLSDTPPAASYTQRSSFFGDGGAKHPSLQPDPVRRPDGAMPYCMVLRHDLHLEPQATINLRFAYGTFRPELSLQFLSNSALRPRCQIRLELAGKTGVLHNGPGALPAARNGLARLQSALCHRLSRLL